MKRHSILKTAVVTAMLLLLVVSPLLACTIFAVGKDATVDGSAIISQTDDSTVADYRLWIIPARDWEEGDMRDIVIDSHNYGDYSGYPDVKDYGNGFLISQIEEAPHTYAYFHSRYSFMNEKGVAMGESTFSVDWTSTELRQRTYDLLYADNDGIIDCWNAQDIALERASTAREAVRIMGDLVENYGWRDAGETINITDGDEVWIVEFYGKDLWCAVRIPDNAFFVGANRARIDHVDFDDPENYMYSPNLKSFAIENGLWAEESGKPFSPAEIYAPYEGTYSTRREWRAFDLVAPSLNLDPEAERFPLYVIPERKLSVQDIFEMCGDYYEGTEYDLSKAPEAGPYGDPLTPQHKERSINLFRTCYVIIAQVKPWLPDEVKCLVWHGYGASDSTYLTPLWPTMNDLPELYSIGSRYEKFDRDSGWWTNSYVQQVARINYQNAIKDIAAFRDPIMEKQYETVNDIQEAAAALVEQGNSEAARALITAYAYSTAEKWHEDWLELGDQLLGRYMWGHMNMRAQPYSDWWNSIMNSAPHDL